MYIDHGSATCGPPGVIMWLAATFVDCVYTIKNVTIY